MPTVVLTAEQTAIFNKLYRAGTPYRVALAAAQVGLGLPGPAGPVGPAGPAGGGGAIPVGIAPPSDKRADAPVLDTNTGSVVYDCSHYQPNAADTRIDLPWDDVWDRGQTTPIARSAWVKYDCKVSGTAVFDTIGTGFDTFLRVLTAAGVEVGTDDDSGNTHGGANGESWISVPVVAGTTYYIRPSPFPTVADGAGTALQQQTMHFNWNVPG